MIKVLVDPAALEEAAKWLEVHSSSSGSAEAFVAEALREAIAHPAKAEGVDRWSGLKLAAEVAEEYWPWEPRLGMTDCEAAFAQFASPSTVLDLIAALSAVTAERDRLAAALSAPDTIKAEPAGDYANLRKQFMSLKALANSNAKIVKYWRDQCVHETRETLLANAANVNAERDTNALLTDSLEAAEAERDRLRAEVETLRKVIRAALYYVPEHKHDLREIMSAAMAAKEA